MVVTPKGAARKPCRGLRGKGGKAVLRERAGIKLAEGGCGEGGDAQI